MDITIPMIIENEIRMCGFRDKKKQKRREMNSNNTGNQEIQKAIDMPFFIYDAI